MTPATAVARTMSGHHDRWMVMNQYAADLILDGPTLMTETEWLPGKKIVV